MALFTPSDLDAWLSLGGAVDVPRAVLVERVASGWLQAATQLPAWPDPTPDDLFGWALELGGMVYDNPTGLSQLDVHGIQYGYGGERAAAILQAAGRRPGNPSGAGSPRWSFPAPAWDETGYLTDSS